MSRAAETFILPLASGPSGVTRAYAQQADGHLGVDQAPVLPPSGPLFRNHGQVRHFQQAVIGGKHRFGLGCLVQLAVETLNGVGGVDQSAHFLMVLEIGAEIGPVGPPGLGDFWVFLAPALPKGVQSIQGCLLIHGGIDRLQVGHKGLQILAEHILAGIAQLVDDTALVLSLGKGGVDGRIKSR